ncbi:MAG: divalent-cation tolerance protein CutA [Lentisphaeria bacterium]|nr:divalent-cation tolerance protein CutA [Candidatus Neomarinimicrobiota bacterium]MCF7843071.1 divalent-cation tolerance protein CutA [Lentisphaeria bacterium]
MAIAGYVVHTTVDEEEKAYSLAQHLVERRLCACAQVIPGITSFYLWKGELEQAGEFLLMLKANASKLNDLMAEIKSVHPYDVPEIIANPITEVDREYLNWMNETVLDF